MCHQIQTLFWQKFQTRADLGFPEQKCSSRLVPYNSSSISGSRRFLCGRIGLGAALGRSVLGSGMPHLGHSSISFSTSAPQCGHHCASVTGIRCVWPKSAWQCGHFGVPSGTMAPHFGQRIRSPFRVIVSAIVLFMHRLAYAYYSSHQKHEQKLQISDFDCRDLEENDRAN